MQNFIEYIFQDWQANQDTSSKSRFVLVMFRSAQLICRLPAPISTIYKFLYQFIVEWIMGIELPYDTQIGKNLKLIHGIALVVNHHTIIGENCTLRHATTIGNKQLADGSPSAAPKIGDRVDIGSNVVMIGDITIGDRAVIGAGSVVVKDVAANTIVAGNPAKVLKVLETATVT
ncbi:serine acetyltransferase [Calothrix sp. 336/3]|uniref:serine acetyltransferase n=1 Tax=Calothrix sp. 336/3 TaxID=1337936 RepID=UPI0004E4143B|nr:DapH/DapD/GlmU-related protein [Calothrix sp. 336/3]AKG21000.1 transferase [Calothrix sp. 336/3]